MQGFFVAFEGIDGSGKSTAIRIVSDQALKAGVPISITHEPREDSAIGRQIYDILYGRLPMVSSKELQRLYVLDRKKHVEELIQEKLSQGFLVITDRFWLSTIAFGMLSNPMDDFIKMHEEVFEGNFIKPDITFFIDVPAEIAMARRLGMGAKPPDHFEKIEKQKKVRENYQTIVAAGIARIEVIDGTQTPDAIGSQIWKILARELPSREATPEYAGSAV